MKKWFFCLFLASTAFGAEFTGALTAKIVPAENLGYFIFSDGSFWKVTTFVKRWRSPIEWLSGEELFVPENYICSLPDWSFGDEFEVYPKYGNSRVDESAASNQEQLKNYSHILVNPRTGKTLFAIPLNPADFTAQLYNEGHAKGYSDGFLEGYHIGFSVGSVTASPIEN